MNKELQIFKDNELIARGVPPINLTGLTPNTKYNLQARWVSESKESTMFDIDAFKTLPEPKPEPKPEQKPEPKPEQKPEPKPELDSNKLQDLNIASVKLLENKVDTYVIDVLYTPRNTTETGFKYSLTPATYREIKSTDEQIVIKLNARGTYNLTLTSKHNSSLVRKQILTY